MCSELPVSRKEHFHIEVKAGFCTDTAGMQIDTSVDFIDMHVAQRVLIDPQTDELTVYWHL